MNFREAQVLTDGFDSTNKSNAGIVSWARLGNCLRHAVIKLPRKLAIIASPVRQALRSRFHTLLYRARQRKGLRVFALGQRLRHVANHVTTTAGPTNGARVRRWIQEKQAGWYAVFEDPQMPMTSTLLDQAHNAIERKLFRDERVSPSRWQSTGVSDGARPPVQPGPLSASGESMPVNVGGSGRRPSTHRGLVPQYPKSSPLEAFDER